MLKSNSKRHCNISDMYESNFPTPNAAMYEISYEMFWSLPALGNDLASSQKKSFLFQNENTNRNLPYK